MKRSFLLLAFISCTSSLFSQTIFTYGGTPVDKEEFMKAYNKNKTNVVDKEASLREYLDLYTKFKLKVKAAQDMQLDTLPSLQTDLQNFRTQVEESYMNNENAVNALVNEAFSRTQKDVHVYHFFVPIAADKLTDTIKAYQALNEIAAKLKTGNTNYDALATDASAKYITVKSGDLGFITGFSVPYDYETIIYNLKPGGVSSAYRSSNGIHLFKVIEERNAVGKWRTAQMLFVFPPGEENSPRIKKRADSVYALLKGGADFAKLAKEVSEDKMTYMTGGEMPEFGTGKFDPAFEKEILMLKNDGDYTAPFASAYGYHIVKRLKQTPTITDANDATNIYDIRQRVLQDKRMNDAKEKFAQDLVTKVGYKKNAAIKDADLYRWADTVAAINNDFDINKFPISNKTVLSIGKTNYSGANWLTFIRDYKGNNEIYKGESDAVLFKKFIAVSAADYYRKHLEDYNEDFRYQMKEFREGNMLFEVMERNVWGSASQDTVALMKQYNNNKAKYLWGESATIILFNCTTQTAAEQAKAAFVAGKDWRKIMDESNNTVLVDSGRYELAQIPAADGTKLSAGQVTGILNNNIDGSASFVKVLAMHPANEQRNFEDARGLVINDYQAVMEDKWMKELKKKYPVKVNEDVFKSLIK